MTFLAEIEPSLIFMILIWLFSSFFSKKGKGKGQSIPKKNRLSNVEKLMEKLGGLRNMDFNQSQPFFSEYEANIFEDDLVEPELYFDEVKVEGGEYIQEEVKVESQLKKKSISTNDENQNIFETLAAVFFLHPQCYPY